MAVDPTVAELARIRAARRMSLREAGARAGLSHSACWCMEHGTHSPTLDSLRKYARALGVPLSLVIDIGEPK